MKRLAIAFLSAAAACMLVAGAISSAQSPATSFPDAFATQITNSSRGLFTNEANQVGSFASDTTANGRFVVIESNGDIATEKTATRNNQDGNQEIFIYDYAQRRIFQVTNTRSVLKPAGSPSPSPSPSPSASVAPSPTPTASPTPPADDPTNVQIGISNNTPMISLEPTLSGGNRTYTVVFSSNAPVSPANFNGTDPGAPTNTDMNQEIWLYQFTVADTADLSSGAEITPVDLSTGTFTRITNTPASRAPSPGGVSGNSAFPPFIADDNREAQITDNGQIIAFTSTRNFTGNNADANPEIFIFNRNTSAFTQVTNTTTTSLNNPIFSSNPALSSDGSVLTFISNANLTSNNDDGGGLSNGEIYVANYNSATGAVSGLRQVTRTKDGFPSATPSVSPDPFATAVVLSFGRRLSRDGRFIAFESIATDPKANGTNTFFSTPYVYDVSADTFAQVGPRGTSTQFDPFRHLPVFTDYDVALRPGSIMWTSGLNFTSNGTLVTDSTGLNPTSTGTNFVAQVFLAPLPVVTTGPFTRVTNADGVGGIGAIPSNTRRRMAYSRTAEFGFGNADGSSEVFYQLLPNITTESPGTLSLFTGASLIPVPVASPTATPSPTVSPSPSPTPSPSPSPSPSVSPAVSPTGLAAGELGVARSSVSLAPATITVSNANASESKRVPALPIELSGVSVALNGSACGLFAVSPTEIKFVIPRFMNSGTYPFVINNNGTVIRGGLTIVAAQPDIFTSTNGPLGRAVVCNATNPAVCSSEPFGVTTNDGTGTQVPTVLRITLTGVRNSPLSVIQVTVGTTVITAGGLANTDLPGSDHVTITLPSTVDTGDLPIVVTALGFSSRDKTTAPHITINAGASPIPNPIDTTAFLVRQHYLDFLGREPDAEGYAFWQNEINSCGQDAQCLEVKRINVSASFFLSIEFQQSGYEVYRTYKAAFGNMLNAPVPLTRAQFLPDARAISNGVIVNQQGWQERLEANKVAYFSEFVTRPQFLSAYPADQTARQFVDKLYVNAGIAPDTAPNRDPAIAEVNAVPADNAARARALRLVAEDPMLVQREFNRAFVLMEYFGYLQRNPPDAPEATLDYQGYNFWLNKLNQFNGNYINAEMVKAFLSSIEYRQRFGQ